MLRTGDRVRLTKPFAELEAGAEGRVLRSYTREVTTYVIRFPAGVVKEIPPDLIEPVGDLPAPGWALWR